MKTENKQYKLKRWYPSLSKEWIEGDILDKHLQELDFFNVSGKMGLVDGDEVRNNPDFWEEVKQPLFITEDGVEVHCRDWELFGVEVSTFKRAVVTSKSLNRHSFLLFANKHNADEYIWRNKPVFSYEDMMKAKHSIILTYEDIEKAAKERSKR